MNIINLLFQFQFSSSQFHYVVTKQTKEIFIGLELLRLE